MATQASGPEPGDWLVAAVRGMHPLRWAACLAALVVTWVVVAIAQSLIDGAAPRWTGWWVNPPEQAREFADDIAGRSTLAIVIRLGPCLAAIAAIWSLAGAWIARHELIARLRSRPGAADPPAIPGPTGLVAGKLKDLILCCPMVVILASLSLLPAILAGGINWLGGGGAVFVAIFLPIVLLGNLLFLLLIFGALAWPLMPVALAAENSDIFDALSRAYNYAYQKPIRFVLLLAVSLGLAAIPLVAVLLAFDGPFAGWPPAAAQTIVFLAAGLSASVFWSLQTMEYLNLRTAIDETDAARVAGGPEPGPDLSKPGGAKEPDTPPVRTSQLAAMVFTLVVVIVTWYVTAWLFMRSGAEETKWLGWGLFEGFVPPAEGLYKIASMLAAVWGVVFLASPLLVAAKRLRDKVAPAPKPADQSKDPAETHMRSE